MAGKRRHRRIIKRLDAEFSSKGSSFRGTSSNFSEGGLFLRTTKPLPVDTQVDVSIHLPDNMVSRLKGTVRWSLKSAHSSGRSGSPRGWSSETGLLALLRPTSSRSWFAQSAKEWMASAKMAPDPVYQAANPFGTAIPPLAPSA